MPKLNDSMKAVTSANNYHFTATRVQDLGASEYTLVTIICDVSTSVACYRDQLEACIKAVLGSCRLSPRAENLMLRLCAFNNSLTELHGFKELRLIQDSDYNGIIKVSGATALYEASFEGIDATAGYGRMLVSRGFSANAIVFVITDGEDNSSRRNPKQIADLLRSIRSEENLETLTTLLVGVTQKQAITRYLTEFREQAELDHYLDLGATSSDALAGLAGFMSRSINMASMSLGSGLPNMAVPLQI